MGQTDSLPLVVSLTTLPSRLELARPAIDSLLNQTRQPDRILLCLPRWSRREGCAYSRPTWAGEFQSKLEVVDCADDYGPGTKLLGSFSRLTEPTCLVLADDDMRYRPFFLDTIYRYQAADRQSSFSFWTYPCGPVQVGQGADGFSFYSPNLGRVEAFAARALQNPSLRLVDDLWISAYLARYGVAVKSLQTELPDGTTIYESSHDLNQLRNLQGSDARDASMHSGMNYLLESGLMGRRAQVRALTKKALRFVLRR